MNTQTYIFQPLTCSICRCKKLWKIQLYLYGFNGILLLFWGRKAAPLCCKTKLDLVRLKCSVKLMEPGRPKCFCSSMNKAFGIFESETFLICVSINSSTIPLFQVYLWSQEQTPPSPACMRRRRSPRRTASPSSSKRRTEEVVAAWGWSESTRWARVLYTAVQDVIYQFVPTTWRKQKQLDYLVTHSSVHIH